MSPVIVELIGSSLGSLSLFQGDVKAMARRLIIICMIYDSLNKFLPLLFQTTAYYRERCLSTVTQAIVAKLIPIITYARSIISRQGQLLKNNENTHFSILC